VIGDVFGKGRQILLDGVRRRAGLPVLYFRAEASERVARDVYDTTDNDRLLYVKEETDRALKGTPASGTYWNPLAGAASVFYDRIRDPRASTTDLEIPRKPDSYILISAGADGFYGTRDDIYNFSQ
jgi:hypothetical protein